MSLLAIHDNLLFRSHAFVYLTELERIDLDENHNVFTDIDGDQIEDLLLFGNNYSYRVNQGKSDAKPMTLLIGQGNGRFSSTADAYLNNSLTWGEYRNATLLNSEQVIAVRNNASPILLEIKP